MENGSFFKTLQPKRPELLLRLLCLIVLRRFFSGSCYPEMEHVLESEAVDFIFQVGHIEYGHGRVVG